MEKLNKSAGQSMDIVADNIAKLKELFPEIITENKIDFKALQALLGEEIEVEDERYSFNWHGKAQARRLAQSPSTGTLRPCKEESVDWDSTQNLFIEGDNLEVLKLLQKSYHKRVKMIYIDPPYNTGNDFVYHDDFKDTLTNYKKITGQLDNSGRPKSTNTESSGRYHSDWLSMLLPRLKLARNLMEDTGVIFISIDDHEAPNLKKICDEVFGEENFIANVIWQRAFSPKNDAKYLSENHDYLMIYSKNASLFTCGRLDRTEEANARYSNPDNDPRGVWISGDLTVKTYSEKYDYPIKTPTGREVMPSHGSCWRISKEKLQELLTDNRIWFGSDGNNVPRLKRFLSDIQDGMVPTTIWQHQEVGHNQEGRQELKDLFGGKGYFDGPKPLRLLERIFKISNLNNQSFILDFFAGSASSGHAVYEHNLANSTNAKFILVQIPEPTRELKENGTWAESDAYKDGLLTIADISKQRLRLAAKKIKAENSDYQGDLGFKVFKLDSSNLKSWDANYNSIAQDLIEATRIIKADRKPEDVLFEILLKYGLDLTLPIEMHTIAGKTVYEVGAGALVVCLDDSVTEAVAEGIGKLKEQLEPELMRVVFKDSSFVSDAAKVNAVQVLKQYGIDDVKSI